jgi:hypothetical protein
MNKIVLDHYPAARLPDDLRRGFEDAREVRVTIEIADDAEPHRNRLSGEQPGLFSQYRNLAGQSYTSIEQVNDRIRALRDEWDHRER